VPLWGLHRLLEGRPAYAMAVPARLCKSDWQAKAGVRHERHGMCWNYMSFKPRKVRKTAVPLHRNRAARELCLFITQERDLQTHKCVGIPHWWGIGAECEHLCAVLQQRHTM